MKGKWRTCFRISAQIERCVERPGAIQKKKRLEAAQKEEKPSQDGHTSRGRKTVSLKTFRWMSGGEAGDLKWIRLKKKNDIIVRYGS